MSTQCYALVSSGIKMLQNRMATVKAKQVDDCTVTSQWSWRMLHSSMNETFPSPGPSRLVERRALWSQPIDSLPRQHNGNGKLGFSVFPHSIGPENTRHGVKQRFVVESYPGLQSLYGVWLGGPLFVASIGLGRGLAARGRAIVQRAVPEAGNDELDIDDDEFEAEQELDEDKPRPAEVFDPLAMVTIEAGRFVMGSGDDDPYNRPDEKPARKVAISGPACMAYPVTRGLYAEVMGRDPGWPDADAVPADELGALLVNNVSWHDAIEFCNALSEQQGLTPCYSIEPERIQDGDEPAGQDRPDHDDVVWHREADGYRLPTEAEWVFLCRAGTQSPWSFGDDSRAQHLESRARLRRGGAFDGGARFMRCAYRFRLVPSYRVRDSGFRCVRGMRRQLDS